MDIVLTLENGDAYIPKGSDEIHCSVHDFVTIWGRLDGIQRLALAEGIDTSADLSCILKGSG